MEFFYRKIYLHSWQIIKTNWHLLFFGIFVAALGLTGDFKAIFNLQNQDIVSSTITGWIEIFYSFSTAQLTWAQFPAVLTLIFLLLGLAIILVMAISSQGALIEATNQSHKNNTFKNPLNSHLQVGVENFWPLFFLNILNKIIAFLFIVGAIVPITHLVAMSQTHSFVNFFIALVLFFIIIPIAVIVSFVTRYGAAYVIIKKQDTVRAFFNAWTLFRVNWIISLENAVLLLGFTALYSIALVSILAFVITPFLIIGFLVVNISAPAFWLLMIVCGLLSIIIFMAGIAIFAAYYTIVWTELFIRLTERSKKHSKIHRLAAKHMPALTK
ncbi:hypothetical protein KBC40_01810 [Patescibacteria group bacterium]|jgi:hypothetical protein|nr:hypothetical protein [Patescibacteria group bacterium]